MVVVALTEIEEKSVVAQSTHAQQQLLPNFETTFPSLDMAGRLNRYSKQHNEP